MTRKGAFEAGSHNPSLYVVRQRRRPQGFAAASSRGSKCFELVGHLAGRLVHDRYSGPLARLARASAASFLLPMLIAARTLPGPLSDRYLCCLVGLLVRLRETVPCSLRARRREPCRRRRYQANNPSIQMKIASELRTTTRTSWGQIKKVVAHGLIRFGSSLPGSLRKGANGCRRDVARPAGRSGRARPAAAKPCARR